MHRHNDLLNTSRNILISICRCLFVTFAALSHPSMKTTGDSWCALSKICKLLVCSVLSYARYNCLRCHSLAGIINIISMQICTKSKTFAVKISLYVYFYSFFYAAFSVEMTKFENESQTDKKSERDRENVGKYLLMHTQSRQLFSLSN